MSPPMQLFTIAGVPVRASLGFLLIVALDKSQLAERIGRLPRQQLEAVLSGVDVVLGR